jgi:hypothetical protein
MPYILPIIILLINFVVIDLTINLPSITDCIKILFCLILTWTQY